MHARGDIHGLVHKVNLRVVSSRFTLGTFVSKPAISLVNFARIFQMIHYKTIGPCCLRQGMVSLEKELFGENYHENYEPCIPASVLPRPPTCNSCECCQCGPTPSHACQTLSPCERLSY